MTLMCVFLSIGFGGTSSAATTPFNQNRPLFGTATTTQSGFGFGSATGAQPSGSLFGSTARVSSLTCITLILTQAMIINV